MLELDFETVQHFVRCTKCGHYHYTEDLRIENVEEDEIGRDVVTYICPDTLQIGSSLVWRGHPPNH